VIPPLVSCVCLTRNRPRFLAKSIELFQAQTYPHKELIIVDSGEQQIELPNDPQVHRLRFTLPFPHAELYRNGWNAANGEYLATWDDDDWHGPERLARTIAKLEESKADAVGLTPIMVFTGRAPVFAQWKPSTIQKWHDDGGRWLPCSDNAIVWRQSASQHARLFADTIGHFRRMYDAGAKFDRIDNDGLFVYVRHSDAIWKFDPNELCDPIPRPAWIPDDMVEFWRGVQ